MTKPKSKVNTSALAEQLAAMALDADSKRGGAGKADNGAVSPDHAAAAWNMQLTSAFADVTTGAVESPILTVSDWDSVLRFFGLDPNEFEVVDDTVKMSRWQQSKGLENGTRSTVWLHSYKARFKRVTKRLPESDVAAVLKDVSKWRPIRRTPGNGLGAPSTFYVGWADWQLGQKAGGGAAGTTQAVLDSFDLAEKRLRELRRIGRNVTSMSVWNMGDPLEGCNGHYANQLSMIELNQREQLNLALRLHLTGIRTFAPLVDDLEYGGVECNHGEWTRTGPGTRAVTDDSDNVGGYLGDTVRTVLADRPGFDHLRFSIPQAEMTMMTDMSGVPVALAHGHKAPSGVAKEAEWIKGQSIRLLRETGREPRLWMLAHRHHYSIVDHGPWVRIQHPSLDQGSKWYTDISGNWSTRGTFSCLVGEHEQAGGLLSGHGTGFSDEMVLRSVA